MYTQKQIDKYKRIKYTRELERFVNRVVSFFHKEATSKEQFTTLRDRIFKPLEDIDKVDLTSNYHQALETFVEQTANLPESQKTIDEIAKNVLHEANKLQMIKRKKSFTKDKHKKRSIENEERHY
ncbi:MAG: hypothetical protein K0U47_11050 [Epsilonproteobacteria bacterium]|nr:hypothetical protein [Campylobacterota bacterium]